MPPLTAPPAMFREDGPLERPPFRLLTDVPAAGTVRRGAAWSARARRIQSHACSPDAEQSDGSESDAASLEGTKTQAVQEMVPASAMLPEAAPMNGQHEDPAHSEAGPGESHGMLWNAPVPQDAPVQAAAGGNAPPSSEPGSYTNSMESNAAVRGNDGESGIWKREQVLNLIQQSCLWGPSKLPEHRSRAVSMPHAAAPSWPSTGASSNGSRGAANPVAGSSSDIGASVPSHTAARPMYRGEMDRVRDEFVLRSTGSENVGATAVGMAPGPGSPLAGGTGYRSHVYSGTLDMDKDEFILDDEELESNA